MTPNLTRYYKLAIARVYNIVPHVPGTYDGRMLAMELELMENHISPKRYAETQAIIWKDWVAKMGLTHLPLNLFLSITAKARYNKLLSTPTVEPILDRELDMYATAIIFERDYAKWYLDQILYRTGVTDEHQALDTYLDDYNNEHLLYGWLDYCDENGRSKLTRAIIKEFCDYWDITQICNSYLQLAYRYADNLKRKRRALSAKLAAMDWKNRTYTSLAKQLDKLDDELKALEYGQLI